HPGTAHPATAHRGTLSAQDRLARARHAGRACATGMPPGPLPSNLGPVASESSFDIVSKINRQELDNALNQAAKEIGTRFDFRGVGATIAWSGDYAVEIKANSEERASAVLDVFKDKLVRRSVSLKVLDPAEHRAS